PVLGRADDRGLRGGLSRARRPASLGRRSCAGGAATTPDLARAGGREGARTVALIRAAEDDLSRSSPDAARRRAGSASPAGASRPGDGGAGPGGGPDGPPTPSRSGA